MVDLTIIYHYENGLEMAESHRAALSGFPLMPALVPIRDDDVQPILTWVLRISARRSGRPAERRPHISVTPEQYVISGY